MSLITRCPACQTLFRVVPDQLRISEGWVRCGQCDEVFDASANLYQEAQATAVFDGSAQVEAPLSQPTLNFNLTVEPNADLVSELGTVELAVEEKSEPSFDAIGLPPVPAATDPPSSSDNALESISVLTADIQGTMPLVAQGPEFPTVSFIREASIESAWHRPLVKVFLGLVSFLLLVVLGLQALIHERDRVATLHPEAKPVLEAICAPLGCTLSPWRQIESVLIDNTSFAKIRGNAYRFGLSIRNSAPIEVAMPALELTLTDSQEQTVLRRVFLPSEFGALTNILPAGGEWSGSFAVSTAGAVDSGRISGYKVLAFYP